MWSLSRLFSITSWWQLLRAKCNVWSRYTSRGDICCLIVFFRETAKLSVYLAPNDSRLLSSSSSSNAIMGKPRTFLVVSLFGILNHFSWMFWQLKPINYTTSAVFPWFSVGMPTNVRTTTSNEKSLKRQWRDKWRLIRKYGRRRQMLAAIKGGISGSENIQICFLFDECHAKNWSDVPYNCRISLFRFTSLQSS